MLSVKILISAAEASSDAHGAALLLALKSAMKSQNGEVDAFGIGGPKLKEAGLRSVVDARELLAMGFTEILGRLPKIFRALRMVSVAAESERPDVAVVIDYPDFHFRLAGRLKRLGIPVIYYIPPKVWVWRKGRITKIRELFARVLCILPFEKEVYEKANVPVTYVGNPLLDELPLSLTRAEARKKLEIAHDARVLVLMPGSRPSELKRHVIPMIEAAVRAAEALKTRLTVLMPLPASPDTRDVERLQKKISHAAHLDLSKIDLRTTQGNSAVCLVAGDAGLIKSGTSTLEAALLGLPSTVVYKPGWISQWIFQNLIRYKGPIGLVNLVSGWKPGAAYLANEIICQDFTTDSITREAISLLSDEPRRQKLLAGFQALKNQMLGDAGGIGPSAVCAREIIDLLRKPAL